MAAEPKKALSHDATHDRALTEADIIGHLGDVDAETIEALLDTDATLADLLTAIAWAAGQTDAVASERRALEGPAAQVYDIITADEEPEDRRA